MRVKVHLLLLFAVFLPTEKGAWGKDIPVEGIRPLAVRVEKGDMEGAVAWYRKHYNPSTFPGLAALRQFAFLVLHTGLRGEDPYERNVVAGMLGRWGDLAALWVLDDALHTSNFMVRRTAADTLGEIGTPGAVAVLRRLYYRGDPESCRLALSALRRTKDKTALPIYLEAVRSSDPFLRLQAIEGLGELRSPLTLPYLRTFMAQEKDPLVRNDIAHFLALLGDRTGLKHLKKSIKDASELVRDSAAGLLGDVQDPTVAPLLRKALQDESLSVRTTAAASLTRFKDPSGLPWVREALVHPDGRVRLAAAISFSRMDYQTARDLIILALASEDPLVRTHAFKVVGENRDHLALPLLGKALLRELDSFVRAEAAWALGQIGKETSVAPLLDLLSDEAPEVRHSSAGALVVVAERLTGEGHE